MADPLDIRNPTWTRDRVLAVAIALPVMVLLFVLDETDRAVVWSLRGVLPLAMIWFPDFLGTYVTRATPSGFSSRFEPASERVVSILGWASLLLWALLVLLRLLHP